MALLLLASLKAAGGAALLPLPYYLALVAAVAMVLRLSRPRLLARRAHQRAELLRVLPLAWLRRLRSNRMRGSTTLKVVGGWVVGPRILPPPGFLVKPRK